MRRIGSIFLLLVLSIVTLTSCNSIKNAVTARTPQLNLPFSCGFVITAYDDMEVEGTMKRLGTGIWEMDITAPETMAGLHITRNDIGMDITLGELEICIGQDKINHGAFAELIFKAIDSCALTDKLTLEETENGLQYSGKVSECPFIMTFSPDTLALSGISFPSIDLEAVITDFCPVTSSESTSASTAPVNDTAEDLPTVTVST